MKKVLSILLSIAMLLSIEEGLNISVFANEIISGKCGDDVSYVLDSTTGELIISGTGNMNDYYNYGDYEKSPFNKNTAIKTATVQNGITYIGKNVFQACTNLTDVNIYDSVTVIGAGAFADCTALQNITISKYITDIHESAFSCCDNLKHIYYSGSEDDWKKINIGEYNWSLNSATIHYNSTGADTKPDHSETPQDQGGQSAVTPTLPKTNPPQNATVGADDPGSPLTLAKPTLKAKAAKKSAKLSWNRIDGAVSYEIQYGTNKKFKKAKTKVISGAKVKVTIKKLKKGKYYFRVRAVNGNVKSVWSKKKAVKIK